jgi:hypothetical protein
MDSKLAPLHRKHHVKVGCCGFAAAQKKYFERFNNNTMKEDALRFMKLTQARPLGRAA